MFKQVTTIIVGAGASCEAGLPDGGALKGRIVQRLRMHRFENWRFQDADIRHWLQGQLSSRSTIGDELAPWWAAAEVIADGLPLAARIDNFLFAHQHDEYVVQLGKAAIALEILKAEADSKFFTSIRSIDFSGPPEKEVASITDGELGETWFLPFVQNLFMGISRDDLATAFSKLRFVIFNYDRCVEHYLFQAVRRHFNVTREEAAQSLAEVEFVHPYGSLGALPWQTNGPPQVTPFGRPVASDYQALSAGIRTFMEAEEKPVSDRIKTMVAQARTLIFLGFGYIEQNVQLLRPPVGGSALRMIGTVYRLSPNDQEVAMTVMRTLGREDLAKVYIETGTCLDLFYNNRLQLTLA